VAGGFSFIGVGSDAGVLVSGLRAITASFEEHR
jgi:hypothetical protein